MALIEKTSKEEQNRPVWYILYASVGRRPLNK